MRILLCLIITVTLIILAFVGCAEKEPITSIEGQWNLEMISDINGEILIAEKAFEGYNGKYIAV